MNSCDGCSSAGRVRVRPRRCCCCWLILLSDGRVFTHIHTLDVLGYVQKINIMGGKKNLSSVGPACLCASLCQNLHPITMCLGAERCCQSCWENTLELSVLLDESVSRPHNRPLAHITQASRASVYTLIPNSVLVRRKSRQDWMMLGLRNTRVQPRLSRLFPLFKTFLYLNIVVHLCKKKGLRLKSSCVSTTVFPK